MSDDEDPLSRAKSGTASPAQEQPRAKNAALTWFKELIRGARPSNSNNLEEALEEYIDELKESQEDEASANSQKILIKNVLKTHDLTVEDVMIPRADIVAIEEKATPEDLKIIFSERPYSRLPVYKDNLDHITGTIHIKDILSRMLVGKSFTLTELVREPIIVSPSLPIMDLFLMMRQDKKHMAFVVDEFGGIDGLVTINDVIEAILGDIEDEFDGEEQPQIIEKSDGSLIADARMDIEEFEERYGNFLEPEEREDIDTLGGLVVEIAGRVPQRGESLRHSSGMVLEIMEADARRVKRLRLRNLPHFAKGDEV